MGTSVNASTQRFLNGLDRIQSIMTDLQDEVSSGIRVRQPSDDPSAVSSILETQAGIGQNTQIQSNLDKVKTELENGDSALQLAVNVMEQAISVATEGTSSTDSGKFGTLLAQAQGIQQQLVSISQTVVAGRYIFSGDSDRKPLYELDPTSPTGVRLMAPAASTRVVTDGNDSTIWLAKTAQDLFDPGEPGTGNVFTAINNLISALKGGKTSDVGTALDELKTAHDYLNQQLGFYGIAENRVSEAFDNAGRSIVSEKQQLSTLRDADIAADATQLTQSSLNQQAALSARAKVSQLSLFDFLA